MSSRALIILSIVLSIFSVYLYVHRDKVVDPKATFDKRIDYMASGIQSIQTNADGQVEMSVHADELVHNLETDTLTLSKVKAEHIIQKNINDKQIQNDTEKNNSIKNKSIKNNATNEDVITVTFQANQALWKRAEDLITLKDDIRIERKTQNSTNDLVDSAILTTQDLNYYTGSQELTTDSAIDLTSQHGHMHAQGLHANLATGIYNFKQLTATYHQ